MQRGLIQAILDRVAAVSTSDGGAICLDDGSQQMSFAQLSDESSELSAELIAAGVGPGKLTGLALSNSGAFPVALLSLMKSGCSIALVLPKYENQEWLGIIEKYIAGQA